MVHIEASHTLLESHQDKKMPKVIIESRFSGADTESLVRNKKFTLACMRDCFMRGEAPYASHVIYAQTHILASPSEILLKNSKEFQQKTVGQGSR